MGLFLPETPVTIKAFEFLPVIASLEIQFIRHNGIVYDKGTVELGTATVETRTISLQITINTEQGNVQISRVIDDGFNIATSVIRDFGTTISLRNPRDAQQNITLSTPQKITS